MIAVARNAGCDDARMDDVTRRSAPRVSYMKEITVEHAGGTSTLTALDLSIGGIGAWGPEECATDCSISLPLDDGQDELVVRGEVARCFRSDGGSVWGIRFVDLDSSASRRLAGHVSRLMT